MDEQTVKRIRSLEKSIYALREINKSDTLRDSVKSKNQGLIYAYTKEICDDLVDELESSNRRLNYQYTNYLGVEVVY